MAGAAIALAAMVEDGITVEAAPRPAAPTRAVSRLAMLRRFAPAVALRALEKLLMQEARGRRQDMPPFRMAQRTPQLLMPRPRAVARRMAEEQPTAAELTAAGNTSSFSLLNQTAQAT